MSSTQEKRADYRPDETELEQPRPRPPHPLPESIGPYHIIEVIGEGGMGVVYKAEQRDPVRRVAAIKVIKLGMDTKEIIARFDAERQALALMSHPNVAKVFEAGMTDTGRPYFAMEFVPGVSITNYCDTQKLTTRERLELFIPVCQAIQHAHQKGIIHRDLKPGNILITLFDGKPVPKVIDFGVAKATSIQLTDKTLFTQTGTVIGTLEYMSPEQATSSGLDVDTRTDVYSLGVILYQLLTGSLPFEPDTLRKASMEMVAHILQNTDPPKPSQRLTLSTRPTDEKNKSPDATEIARRHHTDLHTLRRELQGDLDWIVLKAMEKDRTRRYETASAFAADIQRHLDDEPVDARPPSTLYRLDKFVARHRLGVTAAIAIVASLIAGLAIATYGLIEARLATDHERVLLIKANEATESEKLMRRRAEEQTKLAENKTHEAEQSAHTARTFSDLSQSMLAVMSSPDLRPSQSKTLDDVARQIDRAELAGDALQECKTRLTLSAKYIEIGLQYRAIPQLRKALEINRRLQSSPAQLIANINDLSEALITEGQVGEAEKLLREAVLFPVPAQPLDQAQRAMTLDLLGIVESADDRWTEAEADFTESSWLRDQLSGKVPEDKRRSTDSIAHLAHILCHRGDARGTEMLNEALKRYQREYANRRKGLVGPLRRLAREARIRKDWDRSLALLPARPRFASDPGLFVDLIQTYDAQLALQPNSPDQLVGRASCNGHLGKFDLMARDYDRAISIRPDDPESWFRYLTALQIVDIARFHTRRHEAISRFAKSQDPEYQCQIAKSALAAPISNPDLDTAWEMAHSALTAKSTEPFYVQTMGMAEYRAGHFNQAIDYLTRSQDNIYPYRDIVCDFYAAMAWARLGDLVRARSALEAASRLWDAFMPEIGVDDLLQFREYMLCVSARAEASDLIDRTSNR